VLRAAKDTAWRWEQERPTVALKIKGLIAPSRTPTPPTPPRGVSMVPPAARPAQPGPKSGTGSGAIIRPVTAPRSVVREPQAPSGTGPYGRAEVRQDVLETTKLQLLQALEIDPRNAKAHAMLLVTHYRLGRLDAVMQTVRQARDRGIPPAELRAVPRCNQVVAEELQTCRLPLDLHGEFMEYLGL
jgi:hypothetical protein